VRGFKFQIWNGDEIEFRVATYRGFRVGRTISGLLTSIGKTSMEDLICKEPTKFVAKICVNSKCNRVYQK
jgi:hypothetical protein